VKIMAYQRFTRPDMPVKEVGLRTAKLFQEDIDFIQDKGQHPRTIVREALHIYCDAWRTVQSLPKMTKAERDRFILDKLPSMEVLHTRPDPAIYAQVIENPTITTHTPRDIIKRPAAAKMRAWSKSQRDVYIMYGTVL
jgi:hypothetical protein